MQGERFRSWPGKTVNFRLRVCQGRAQGRAFLGIDHEKRLAFAALGQRPRDRSGAEAIGVAFDGGNDLRVGRSLRNQRVIGAQRIEIDLGPGAFARRLAGRRGRHPADFFTHTHALRSFLWWEKGRT